ncbi:MAG: methyltransferase domain-containing protein [Thermoleophilaceae bacterium]
MRAAGRHAPVSAYDRAVGATMRERAWRPALVDRVLEGVPAGGRVVDVGAGTGSLAIALSRARPDVTVTGVDGDPQALGIARSKAGGDGVEWLEGTPATWPWPMAPPTRWSCRSCCTTSRLTHSATRLREARRVLAPSGCLHIADFGRPQDPLMAAAFALLRLADGRRNTAPHAAGKLSATVIAAGFGEPRLWKSLRTGFGTLELMSAAPVPGGVCG